MNKTEALQRLTAIEKEAEELRAIINAPDKGDRWKPEKNRRYYYVHDGGGYNSELWVNHPIDTSRFNSGNCYRTTEEAERAAEILKTIGEKRFWPDWSDLEQIKWYITYCHTDKKFRETFDYTFQSSGAYYPDKQTAQSIIDQYGDDLFLVMDRI